MKKLDLYTETCFECCKIITQKYSTSFSIGIKVFEKNIHFPIYGVYAFVRFADEIVDTFHEHHQELLFQQFKNDCYGAIVEKVSLNPVLHAFQFTFHQYQIPLELVNAFLNSMEMDLKQTTHNELSYKNYIYGSAEVVGLMCLKVFCGSNEKLYQELIIPAKSLGAAFQKVNFLRDIKDDFIDKGRTYFPNVNFNNFTESDKKIIESDIQLDFDQAFIGIQKLPLNARKGVLIAYTYYLELLKKIKQVPAETLVKARVRISDSKKMWLLAQTFIKNKVEEIC